jgi:hypothetical protein
LKEFHKKGWKKFQPKKILMRSWLINFMLTLHSTILFMLAKSIMNFLWNSGGFFHFNFFSPAPQPELQRPKHCI